MGADFQQLIFQFLTELFWQQSLHWLMADGSRIAAYHTFNDPFFEKKSGIEITGLLRLEFSADWFYWNYHFWREPTQHFFSPVSSDQGPEGNLSMNFGNKHCRKGLVAFQFFHLFSSNRGPRLIMSIQMKAIRNFALGFGSRRWFLNGWMSLIFSFTEFHTTSVEEEFLSKQSYNRQALIWRDPK